MFRSDNRARQEKYSGEAVQSGAFAYSKKKKTSRHPSEGGTEGGGECGGRFDWARRPSFHPTARLRPNPLVTPPPRHRNCPCHTY